MRRKTITMLAAGLIAGLALGAAHAADRSTVVIGTTQVPRHFNGAVQSGVATAMPSTQIFASPLRYDDNWNSEYSALRFSGDVSVAAAARILSTFGLLYCWVLDQITPLRMLLDR